MGKTLWTELGEGDPVKVRELEDEHAEARFVVGEIERLVDEGVSRKEIAIFYRINAQSRVLEDTLVRPEIRYQVIGGTKFYERAEIKDAIAYLTVLGNPQDAISLHADRQLAQARHRADVAVARARRTPSTMGVSVWEAAADPGAVPGLGTAAVRAFERFMATMAVLRERAEQQRADRRPARRDPARDRLPRRARGRAHDRGAGAHREPRRSWSRSPASSTRARRRTPRSTCSCSRSRWWPTPTRAATTRAS